MLCSFVFLLEVNNLKLVFANFDLLQSSKNYYLYGNSDLFILYLVKCSQILHLVPPLCKAYFRVYNPTVSSNTHYLHILWSFLFSSLCSVLGLFIKALRPLFSLETPCFIHCFSISTCFFPETMPVKIAFFFFNNAFPYFVIIWVFFQ